MTNYFDIRTFYSNVNKGMSYNRAYCLPSEKIIDYGFKTLEYD